MRNWELGIRNESSGARRVRVVSYLPLLLPLLLLWSCGTADMAVKKGDKFYALGEYYDAATQYRKAYQQTPAKDRKTRGQRALKMADCYRRINYTAKAVSAYNNAVRYGQADSLTLLRLGQQQMLAGNYKAAATAFAAAADTISAAISEMRGKGDANSAKVNEMRGYLALAKTGMKSAEMAPQWKKEGSRYTVKKEGNFNSRRADFSPVLGGEEGEILYFSSTRNQSKGDELSGITGQKTGDIFMAQKDEKGKWQRPENIDSELNSEFDEGACALTPDGKTMYLTKCVTDPSYPRYAQICRSSRSDASWGKPQDVVLTKDTLSNFAHPAVSPDGKWLYFTSDMPGGMGGFDIWRAQLTNNGDVVAIENLGEPINTPGDEKFPTFRPNGDLYFSSDGHPGMGGLDIFIAKPNEQYDPERKNGQPYVIEHPGYPLNSQGDDFGMTFEGLLNRGFFSSNRGDGKGWDHIYSFVNPEIIQTVKGWVYEKDGYELPQGVVYMIGDDGTNLKLSVKGDGSFEHQIKPGVEYAFLGTCKGYLNHSESLKVEPVEESTEYTLQFALASITAPVLIDNIFYDFDKATLRPESTAALDQLVKLLNENPNVTIELSAHCDYKGSEAYNKLLSQRRAESVVAYLKQSGIAADRLTPVGYGKERPKTVNKKLAEKQPFLKENDVLSEEFIKQLKEPGQQEICNQLNRRTEFRVLRTTYGMFKE